MKKKFSIPKRGLRSGPKIGKNDHFGDVGKKFFFFRKKSSLFFRSEIICDYF